LSSSLGKLVRAVPEHETGSAMGFYQVVRYVGFSLGSALAAALLASETDGPATVRTVTEAGRDIENREDCEQLVRAFYARALSDPVIGFIFTDVARLDLEAHVPVIASFWATILLGARSYGGGAFAAHAALDAKVRLRPGHFARWLALWRESVDAQF